MHKSFIKKALQAAGISFLLFFFAFESCHTTYKNPSSNKKDEIKSRIALDFSKNEEQIRNELKPYFSNLNDSLFSYWENTQKLENRIIDGEKRYFRNAVPNLFRLDSTAMIAKYKTDGEPVNLLDTFCLNHTTNIIEKAARKEQQISKKFRMTFTITLADQLVPVGETVRCWLPFPRESAPRQSNVKLLGTSQADYILTENEHMQRSLYMEKEVDNEQPVTFSYTADFETKPTYIELDAQNVLPYHKETDLYKNNTAERLPHIHFTPEMKKLADEIAGDKSNPVEIVRAIYYWINQNIPWASALEYSTFQCIPKYVIENKHGDCGMQTLLFMTLARIKGIPCKWQSGWMLHPNEENLHDWCEVYYEGIGWVPLDQSFGLQNSANKQIREFYMQGIDTYRLIINDDFSREFNPKKDFFRSEPIDFQRGELEWKEGNIYFDKWNYKLELTELNNDNEAI